MCSLILNLRLEKSFKKVDSCFTSKSLSLLSKIIIAIIKEKNSSVFGTKFIYSKEKKDLKTCKIDIVFVSRNTIQYMNFKYKGKKYDTDVISFRYDSLDLYAEIYVSPYTVAKNAKKFRTSFCNELYRVVIHGILHTLGYTHSKKMFAIQENILHNFINKLSKNSYGRNKQ